MIGSRARPELTESADETRVTAQWPNHIRELVDPLSVASSACSHTSNEASRALRERTTHQASVLNARSPSFDRSARSSGASCRRPGRPISELVHLLLGAPMPETSSSERVHAFLATVLA